jgi:pantetheine-phosphate adenylyltransferase
LKVAVYPGSFDPFTLGHADVIERSAKLVDKLIVAVLNNSAKKSFFTLDERLIHIKEMIKNIPNAEAGAFSGLLVDFARLCGANIIIRGLRALTDFEYEFQMALTNKSMADEIDTIFLATNIQHLYLSSSIVKEVVAYGGNVDNMVPPFIKSELMRKLALLSSAKEDNRGFGR